MDCHRKPSAPLVLRHAIGLVERPRSRLLASKANDLLGRIHRQFLEAGR